VKQGVGEITPQSLAVVASTLVGSMFSGGLVAMTAIAVFVGSIAREYGWSHGTIGGAMALLYLGMAMSAPVFGRIVDRCGPRIVLLPLTFLSGLLLASFSVIGASLPLFYAAHLLLGISQPGTVTYSKLISTWFFRHRGMALTAMGVGGFLAQFGVPPIARLLMGRFGWQDAYLAFGGAEMLVAFPFLIVFFRERKAGALDVAPGSEALAEADEVRPDGAPPIGVLQAMRGRTYWLLVAAQAGVAFAFLGVSTHGVGILEERGLDTATAVWGLSSFALGGLASQILTGYLLDRFDTPRTIAPFAILTLLGLLLVQFGHGYYVVLPAVFLFGAGCAACSPISYFTSRYFGVRNLSAIYGSLFPITLLLCAPAPVVMGAIFDATGSYSWALTAADLAIIISVAFFLLLQPYPYPVKEVREDSRTGQGTLATAHLVINAAAGG
jgi:sugar phosphate permease